MGGLGPEAVLKASDLGPWGRLKLVEKLETGGDHRVDALFDKLILKFDHWALQHPNLARESGIKPGLMGSTISTSQVHTDPSGLSSPPRSGSAGGGLSSAHSSPLIVLYNTFGYDDDYGCGQGADMAAEPPGVPSGIVRDMPGAPNPNPLGPPNPSELLTSDANLLTGAFLQSYQVTPYQSLGLEQGVDLVYSSLQAYPNSFVGGTYSLNNDVGGQKISTIDISFSVNGTYQGPPIEIRNVSNGQYHLAVQAGNLPAATGVYPMTMSFLRNYAAGGSGTDNFSSALAVVNRVGSPYGCASGEVHL